MGARILMTGGSGCLGRELCRLLPEAVAPPRAELDIADADQVEQAVARHRPALIVHAAAYTDVVAAERDREGCWRANAVGTAHVARAAARWHATLVHISTDYVFRGDRGMYREDEPPGPVVNYYALTKLAAEAAARTVPRHLVVRTSFRPRVWPHPVAFTDYNTSQDYVDVLAPDIARAIRWCARIPFDTLHIATERKTAYDLARRRRPEVRPASKRTAAITLPDDVSLDVSRWAALKPRLGP